MESIQALALLDDPSKLSGLLRQSSEVQVVAAAGWLDIGGSGWWWSKGDDWGWSSRWRLCSKC